MNPFTPLPAPPPPLPTSADGIGQRLVETDKNIVYDTFSPTIPSCSHPHWLPLADHFDLFFFSGKIISDLAKSST